MVLDPIPLPLPVHFFGSRPQPPTSPMERLSSSLSLSIFSFLHNTWSKTTQRFVESILFTTHVKTKVVFRKRATNYRALSRKKIYKDKTSYDSKPPCSPHNTCKNALILGVTQKICENTQILAVTHNASNLYECIHVCHINHAAHVYNARMYTVLLF